MFKNIIDDIKNNPLSIIHNNDLNYKIVLGGDIITGKSRFRCANNKKQYYDISTIGGAYSQIKREINNLPIIFHIWDTSGWGGRFDDMIELYLRDCNGILLLFGLNKRESFLILDHCCNMINKHFPDLSKIPILLIGTHADLYEQRQTKSEEAIEYSKNKNFVGYFEISSITRKNVEESFDFRANCLYQVNELNTKLSNIEFKIKLY